MIHRDLIPGERITCPQCSAVYEVYAEGMIETHNDARCRVCRTTLTRWRQYVGLRHVEQSETTPDPSQPA